MNSMNISNKLANKKYTKPNKMLYCTLTNLVVKSLARKYNTSFNRSVDLKKYKKKQFILIGNHASRADYVYASLAVGPTIPLNFVLARNEFYRSHLQGIVNLVNCIPKKNFVPDTLTIRAITSVIKNGGNLCFFPEGMSSVSGAQQPVALGTGKMLKHYKLPVLCIKIKGGYLTNVKFNLFERPGKTEVELFELFSPEELENLTAEEIQSKVDEVLYNDDYEWNLGNNYKYKSSNIAQNIHQLLFKCPVCGKEYSITDYDGKIACINCGLSVGIDNTYKFILPPNMFLPATPAKWYEWERRIIRKEVLSPDFLLSEKVALGVLPEDCYLKNQATSTPSGEGVLTLDKSGLKFKGLKNGEPFEMFIESKNLPTLGMCTDASKFYTFAYNGEYLEFVPLEHESAAKWFITVEEVHRANGGKWQNYPWFDYDDITAGFIKT